MDEVTMLQEELLEENFLFDGFMGAHTYTSTLAPWSARYTLAPRAPTLDT